MIKNNVTADEVIDLLNSMVKADPKAAHDLAFNRVKCNETLANHPTIQVGMYGNDYMVGLVGVLNGIFGINDNGWGIIASIIDEDTGKLIRFEKLPDNAGDKPR